MVSYVFFIGCKSMTNNGILRENDRKILEFWNWEIGKFPLILAIPSISKFPNSKIPKFS